ncbi:hypothetical protein TNCV_2998311 [Trichonephila clavipes]|nr:hypothetical protein TNCV_2998311 [Trichonephila clavipes]
MERGKEDQTSSSINHIKNLTLLTSSKYNELKGNVTLSEWTKTAPQKKSSMPNQLAHKERLVRLTGELIKKLCLGTDGNLWVRNQKNWVRDGRVNRIPDHSFFPSPNDPYDRCVVQVKDGFLLLQARPLLTNLGIHDPGGQEGWSNIHL